MANETPKNYGAYSLQKAELISLPQLTATGVDWFAPPPQGRARAAGGNGNGDTKLKRLEDYSLPDAKRLCQAAPPPALPPPAPPPPPPPPPPPAPPISSVGVMDVGQGNCNVLIDALHQPVTYYDVGYPLWFFLGSLPANMRFGTPAYLGPYQPAAPNMNVVLSHWDWDHWRLGRVANLTNLQWTIPNLPGGPVAVNFRNELGANAQLFPAGALIQGNPAGTYTMYRCTPTPGMPHAALMNNSGVALSVWTRLPVGDPTWHRVFLTADANFNTLPFPWFTLLGMTGATAVHHGSNNYGAPENLPAPTFPYGGLGRIAYSYGALPSGKHPYGFPGNFARLSYRNSGWMLERSTADGIVQVPPGPVGPAPNRGNVRMGDQTPLNFPNSAFNVFPIPNQLE